MDKLTTNTYVVHTGSIRNKTIFAHEQTCGCFYCQRIYSSNELKDDDFIQEADGNYTAWCPYCGIDSVIGEAQGYEITPALLAEMRKVWFD